MFQIAPHGKTVIVQLPYQKGKGAVTTLPLAKIGERVAELERLVGRFDPGAETADSNPFRVTREDGGVVLSCPYPPHLIELPDESIKTQTFLTMPEALHLARALRAAEVQARTRTRSRAPGAQTRTRKRISQ